MAATLTQLLSNDPQRRSCLAPYVTQMSICFERLQETEKLLQKAKEEFVLFADIVINGLSVSGTCTEHTDDTDTEEEVNVKGCEGMANDFSSEEIGFDDQEEMLEEEPEILIIESSSSERESNEEHIEMEDSVGEKSKTSLILITEEEEEEDDEETEIEKDYEEEMVYPLAMSCSKNKKIYQSSLSPLTIPLLHGWRRVNKVKRKAESANSQLYYISPCGQKLMNMTEVQRYLISKDCVLTVDQFTFDKQISLQSNPVPSQYKPYKMYIPDLSNGTEDVPIPCVNWLNEETPSPFKYVSTRRLDPNVHILTDKSFMITCDCDDGCVSSDMCACRRLTIEEGRGMAKLGRDPKGYEHRRLLKQQISGVYECNQHCKCSQTCSNRVVQFGPRHQLIVFRTEKMGWGVMTLDDIPQGTFICTYNGQVCKDETANEKGLSYGDEFMAELDYVEILQQMKEGYEENVVSPSIDKSLHDFENNSPSLLGDLYLVSATDTTKKPCLSSSESSPENYYSCTNDTPLVLSKRSYSSGSDSTIQESLIHKSSKRSCLSGSESPTLNHSKRSRQSNSGSPFSSKQSHLSGLESPTLKREDSHNAQSDSSTLFFIDTTPLNQEGLSSNVTSDNKLFRRLYNEDYCYVIDAKNMGNVGRFINHSCSPNLFVQNVFIDSHDLRFPWVAFFAKSNIPAFTELYWDYNYVVGSVEDREIMCHCGAPNCRKRLL